MKPAGFGPMGVGRSDSGAPRPDGGGDAAGGGRAGAVRVAGGGGSGRGGGVGGRGARLLAARRGAGTSTEPVTHRLAGPAIGAHAAGAARLGPAPGERRRAGVAAPDRGG